MIGFRALGTWSQSVYPANGTGTNDLLMYERAIISPMDEVGL